ncbi:helical backbone metal receptor [Pseudomonas turukhanskensis]|uniref:Cobalamin-binding protein n=1 Tax=Pseudomonas turukhanskensis TaxID=1806536 RepID=A0A9W6NH26_9PSED|nr:helical backbone metal receptor [Pseudomonas turukhanskensis]GLK90447.1 cobalamin-binding protein [Pseudomonas turukhanskensis]
MRLLLACLLGLLAWPAAAQLRVVTLAPSLSEIMLELDAGDLLVGVLDGGERPQALAHLPSVGRYGQLEMEGLLALKPDLLLLWPDSISAAQRQQLIGFGIPLYEAEPHSLEQLAEQFAAIGVRVGRAEQGRMRAAEFGQRLAALKQRFHRSKPLPVFYQIWNSPLYTVGGGQIISDALGVCGARNVFADLSLPAPQVSIEAVLQRDPHVIVGGDQPQLDSWARWPQLKAVHRQQLLVLPDKGLERPSLQMLDATERLCAALAPMR